MWASTAGRAKDNTPARSSRTVRSSGAPTSRSVLNSNRSAHSTRFTAKTVGRAASLPSQVRALQAHARGAGTVPEALVLQAAARSVAVGADEFGARLVPVGDRRSVNSRPLHANSRSALRLAITSIPGRQFRRANFNRRRTVAMNAKQNTFRLWN